MILATIDIPTSTSLVSVALEAGHSTIFVGANGSGKTRLGVRIEQQLATNKVRRIAAHRSLTMSDKLASMNYDRAIRALETGHPEQGGNREAHRYQQKPATVLLSDYDYLLQALFAQQNREAVIHLQNHTADRSQEPPVTVLAKLKAIWERLLPHRKMRMLEMSVEILPTDAAAGPAYPGSEMSDGERVMFYLIGHCLLAPAASVIIVDEPELHIHKAILGRLWDAIEAARKDCSFVYITHDLDFLVTRPTAQKFVVRSYSPAKNWEIELLPVETELPDRVVSELVGSRQPVLFVEGDRESVDATIYRNVYANFLVQPIGSCDAVIHAVSSFRRNTALHRIGTVNGCIDADAREEAEISRLRAQDVYVLPVAEIENALLLPSVFPHLVRGLHFVDNEVTLHQNELTAAILNQVSTDIDPASVRYAVRRLDAALKRLAPAAHTSGELITRFNTSIAAIDIGSIVEVYKAKLKGFVDRADLTGILSMYDNKGLLSLAAKQLGLKGRGDLVELAGRLLGGEAGAPMLSALRAILPELP